MLDLKYKAKDIRNFERDNECSIFDILDIEIDHLVTFIKLGYGVDEDRAFDLLDKELEKEDMDTIGVLEQVMTALQRYGFFPRRVNLAAILKKIESSFTQINEDLEKEQVTVPSEEVAVEL